MKRPHRQHDTVQPDIQQLIHHLEEGGSIAEPDRRKLVAALKQQPRPTGEAEPDDPGTLLDPERMLAEREKEMNCLYHIMEVMLDRHNDTDRIYRQIVHEIPHGFFRPDRTGAQLVIDGTVYASKDYREGTANLSSDIVSAGRTVGRLTVAVDQSQQQKEEPFLEEERQLMEKLVDLTGNYYASREAEQRLEENRQYYRSLFEHLPEAIITLNRNGEIISANDAAARQAETGRDTLAGQSFTRFVAEEEMEEIWQLFYNTLQGNIETREISYLTSRGDRRTATLTCIPVIVNEQILGVHAIVRDNTERKRQHEQLQFQAQLLDQAGEAIIATDLQGRIIYWNKAANQIYGWTAGEAMGEDILDVTPAKLSKKQAGELMAYMRKGKSWTGEFPVQRKDGTMFEALVSNTPLLNDQGDLEGIIGISWDISQRKQAEELAEKNRKLLEVIAGQAEAAVWIRDARGRHVLVNQEYCALFGLERQQVEGKSLDEVLDKKTARQFAENDRKALDSEESLMLEELVNTYKGERYYKTNIFAIKDIPGLDKAVGGIATDITELKKAEQRALKQQQAIAYLAMDQELLQTGLEEKLRTIARVSAETLDISDVNIWKLEDGTLHCISSYNRGEYDKEVGATIDISEHSYYFEELKANRAIAVKDVENDPCCRKLADQHCKPRGIRSLLDNSVHLSGKPIGLVGHNHTGEPRSWQTDEIMFGEAISDRVAEAFAEEKRREMEQQIRESLNLKETLLAEIHHRVKNNLATISSFLQLQSMSTKNPEVYKVLSTTELRIRSISMIYEKLYEAGSLSELYFDQYIGGLTDAVNSALNDNDDINLHLECDHFSLEIKQAVPCALIINELVTNAFKHAFAGKEDAGTDSDKDKRKEEQQIHVRVRDLGNEVDVMVTDNGKGLPDDFDEDHPDAFGFSILQILTSQLKAGYNVESEGGTKVTFRFTKAES